MHAVTGPYAREIFERRLGAPAGHRGERRPAAGFRRPPPDPNPTYAADLVAALAARRPRFRRRLGRRRRPQHGGRPRPGVGPSDSLAVLAANARLVPWFKDGLPGVARSMPTSRAVDRVAAALGIHCYETPTGWKFFGNAARRRPDRRCAARRAPAPAPTTSARRTGVWAVLFWLNMLAVRGEPATAIVRRAWAPLRPAITTSATITRRSDRPRRPADRAAARQPPALPGRTSARTPSHTPTISLTPIRSTARSGAPRHPDRVRRRRADRLPAVRYRHRGRDVAGLPRTFEPDLARHDIAPQAALRRWSRSPAASPTSSSRREVRAERRGLTGNHRPRTARDTARRWQEEEIPMLSSFATSRKVGATHDRAGARRRPRQPAEAADRPPRQAGGATSAASSASSISRCRTASTRASAASAC